ncbi:MAG TPA: hypothetical protein VI299_12860 [Polyangiales bacterium]
MKVMTLRQSETLLRALVALALGIGFVGFATHSHTAHAGSAFAPVAVEAAPIADASHPAGT